MLAGIVEHARLFLKCFAFKRINQRCPTSQSRSTGRPPTVPKLIAKAVGMKKNFFLQWLVIDCPLA